MIRYLDRIPAINRALMKSIHHEVYDQASKEIEMPAYCQIDAQVRQQVFNQIRTEVDNR